MLPFWKIVAIMATVAQVKVVAFVAVPPCGYDEARASFAQISERRHKEQMPFKIQCLLSLAQHENIVSCYIHSYQP